MEHTRKLKPSRKHTPKSTFRCTARHIGRVSHSVKSKAKARTAMRQRRADALAAEKFTRSMTEAKTWSEVWTLVAAELRKINTMINDFRDIPFEIEEPIDLTPLRRREVKPKTEHRGLGGMPDSLREFYMPAMRKNSDSMRRNMASVTSLESKLALFYSLYTNTLVEDFPSTAGELLALGEEQSKAILKQITWPDMLSSMKLAPRVGIRADIYDELE